MKIFLFAFFCLLATVYAGMGSLSIGDMLNATASGEVGALAGATEEGGAASGFTDEDNGVVLGVATVGNAIAGAFSSPFL